MHFFLGALRVNNFLVTGCNYMATGRFLFVLMLYVQVNNFSVMRGLPGFNQGSKIALVRSYLQVPQAAGQVKISIFPMKIKYFPIYANNFCDAGQVLILRYFEAC